MSGFGAVVRREFRLALRHGGDTAGPLLFLFVAATLFPLALGPGPQLLARIAPGVVWVCALLAALLPLERLFAADFEDGSLDLLLASGVPGSLVALAKAVAHWALTGVPLLVAAAPLAVMLHVPAGAMPALLGGLALGTATLSLLGTAAAALVLGARRGGVLLPVLVLPLTVPVVIFGAAAADGAAAGLPVVADLLLLGAIFAACVPLCPLAAGAGLRAAVD